MSKVAAQAAKASPMKDKKDVGASGAGTSPSMGAEVNKGEKGSSKTLQASVAVAVLVAFASIYAGESTAILDQEDMQRLVSPSTFSVIATFSSNHPLHSFSENLQQQEPPILRHACHLP